jgi:hypothetical protein
MLMTLQQPDVFLGFWILKLQTSRKTTILATLYITELRNKNCVKENNILHLWKKYQFLTAKCTHENFLMKSKLFLYNTFYVISVTFECTYPLLYMPGMCDVWCYSHKNTTLILYSTCFCSDST